MHSRKTEPLWWLPWAVLAAALAFAVVVRTRLLMIPLERDEGEYAYAGQLLLQGTPPYREAFNMKFPGVYGAYALIMAIFGQSIAGIHLGFLIVNALTIVMMFFLGRRLLGAAAGAAAAAAYAVMSVDPGVFGTQAHATHFVVAAVVAGCLLLLRAVEGRSAGVMFASGAMFGIAILMKQHGVFFAIFAGACLLWENRREWRRVAVLYAGVALPLLLTAIALWRAGVFERFWFWTFTYAREYVSETSLNSGFFNLLLSSMHVAGREALLWFCAAAGLILIARRKEDRARLRFLVLLASCSFLAIVPGFYFREHYFVMLLPAAALLVGAAARGQIGPWIIGAAMVATIVLRSGFLFGMTAVEASRNMYGANPFVEAISIADYLHKQTIDGDRIAVIGSEPEIYFYSGRRSVTGYIYTYGMMEDQPFAIDMQDEMIRDIESGHPAYVVRVMSPYSWLAKPASSMWIFDWWQEYQRHYTRVSDPKTDGGLEVYRLAR